MAESGIYEIVNLVNGKRYVGSAVRLKKRWAEHRRNLNSGNHHSLALQRSWNKYGPGSFAFQVIEHCPVADLIGREQAAFDVHSPEYNICKVAGSTLGATLSADAKRKIAEWNRGRKLSPEHVEAIRRGHIGKRRVDMDGNKWGSRKHTEQERLINSLSKKGRPKSPTARANIASAAASPEMRAKRSRFMKEVWAKRKSARL